MPESHASDPLIGSLIAGRYRVLRPLGEGGMGQVYLAEHEAIEKQVALKVLKAEYSRKADIVTRFQQEAISASRIKHPNVLDVFDFGKLESGEAFLAMEFLEGHDLSDDLAKTFVLDPARGIQIALQICRALAAAHSKGVVHRDMKPDNVFLQRTGDGEEVVKIVDFGIAQLRTNEEVAKTQPTRRRLTKTGMIFGTPEYMSPEQAAGRAADLRVDIYALGVILYEMFTGSVPFTGDSFMAVLAKTLNDPPPPMIEMNRDLRVSSELESVIMRSLSKNPDQRYASMTDFSNALLGTPEGAQFGRSLGSIAGGRLSSYPEAAGAPTAAQFADRGAMTGSGTVAVSALTAPSTGGTAAIGTPTGIVDRTATPLGGQSATVVPSRTPSTGLVLGALGLVAVLGIGGYFAFSRGRSTPPVPIAAEIQAVQPTTTTPSPSLTPSALVPAPATASTETVVVPVTGAPANTVHLHVVTEPVGAVLSKADFQVCEATPCDLTVPRNEGLELTARKGTMRGQVKILPQGDQTVTIPLVSLSPKPKPAERLCEVDVGGLKILRPCK